MTHDEREEDSEEEDVGSEVAGAEEAHCSASHCTSSSSCAESASVSGQGSHADETRRFMEQAREHFEEYWRSPEAVAAIERMATGVVDIMAQSFRTLESCRPGLDDGSA